MSLLSISSRFHHFIKILILCTHWFDGHWGRSCPKRNYEIGISSTCVLSFCNSFNRGIVKLDPSINESPAVLHKRREV